MNNKKIASELFEVKKLIKAGDTFKCPTCGTKVLKQTGYCLKCKKKVKEASSKKTQFLDVAIPQLKRGTGIDALDAVITNLIAASNFDERLSEDDKEDLKDASENLRYLLDNKMMKEFDKIKKILKSNKFM